MDATPHSLRAVRLLVTVALLLLAAAMASPMPLETLQQADAERPVRGPEDAELQWKTDALIDLVRADPWRDNVRPLLYFELEPTRAQQADAADDTESQPGPGPNPDEEEESAFQVRKRSRYYRRYPWKRVTRARGSYDPDLYMCTPSREDVIQLLVGLHRAREGDTARTINFCNRKRPASSVFTNIRFIG